VAEDGHAVSYELNDFVLTLADDPGAGLAGAIALSGALAVELPADYNLAAFLLVLRGHLEATAQTEAVVSCSIGHSTRSLSWPPPASLDAAGSGSVSAADGKPAVNPELTLECFSSDTSLASLGVSNSFPPVPITLSIQARRRTADELILVQIESIDVIMLGNP
jgi:hypothetical protein